VPTYYTNWAAFDLPDVPFVDRTTHCLELLDPEHLGVLLVVVRETFPEGKTLRELAAGRVAEEMARIRGFTLLSNEQGEWSGMPAVEVTSRWRHEGRAIYQRQAHLALGDSWTYFSVNGPLEHKDACDAYMARIRASLQPRSDG
jgi:hypothetical protein